MPFPPPSSHPFHRTMLALVLAAAPFLHGCGPAPEPPPTFHPSTPAEAVALNDFNTAVKPVLRQNCYRCHSGMNHKGGFNLSTRDLLLKGGKSGVDVVPGHPEQSRLVVAIRREGDGIHPKPMPPKDALSASEIAAIEKWIQNGAIMDR